MDKMFSRVVVIGAVSAAWFISAAADAATLSLKAVRRNGNAIAPTNNLNISPNDTIDAEMYISGWANDFGANSRIRTFQFKLDGRAAVESGVAGSIYPIGWCAPINPDQCTIPSDCTVPPFTDCQSQTGCVCPSHDPTLGAFIDSTRTDYIFAGFLGGGEFQAVSTPSLDYRLGSSLFASTGPLDPGGGAQRYVGTLKLQVSADVEGTFTFGFQLGANVTFIANQTSPPTAVALTVQPLVLSAQVIPAQIISMSPPRCDIDARMNFDPNNTATRHGFQEYDLQWDRTPPALAVASFAVSTIPESGFITINSVTPLADNKTRVRFGRKISAGTWTCIRHIATNSRWCFGFLPADINGDGTAAPADILDLIDDLNHVLQPPLAIYQCDTDQSLVCNPADILTVIDLLNGAGEFDVWNGASLPACPSITP